MTSDDFATYIRDTITDDYVTYPNVTQYNVEYANKFDDGTSHLSVMSANGDAVSVTSTINNRWASGVARAEQGLQLLPNIGQLSVNLLIQMVFWGCFVGSFGCCRFILLKFATPILKTWLRHWMYPLKFHLCHSYTASPRKKTRTHIAPSFLQHYAN